MNETIRGELTSFRVLGQDFWGRGSLRTQHDRGEVTLIGKLVGANVGDTVECEGYFETSKYGHQFRLRTYRVVLPSDVRGVVGWLAAKLPQISARRAEELVQRFGVAELWSVLDRGDAAALCVVDGVTPDRAQAIVDAYQTHRAGRDQLVRLKQFGLTDGQAERVIKKWGAEAESKLVANPYSLIEHVHGFGWERADAVALRMGVRRDDGARLAAALMHAMQDTVTGNGHCYAPVGKLVAITAKKICGISDEGAVRRVLFEMIRKGKLAQLDQNVYLPAIAEAEGELATEFAERCARGAA